MSQFSVGISFSLIKLSLNEGIGSFSSLLIVSLFMRESQKKIFGSLKMDMRERGCCNDLCVRDTCMSPWLSDHLVDIVFAYL